MKFTKMSPEEKKDWIETFFGGACGIAAIVAAVIEYRLGDNGAVAGMLKDIFGTAVVVVLLLMAMPKIKPWKLDKVLEKAVEAWGESNAPLIFKAEGYVQAKNTSQTQCFLLLQNPKRDYISLAMKELDKDSAEWKDYAKYGKGHLTGKFLDMPSYKAMTEGDFEILLCMEQAHFKKMPEIDGIIEDLDSAISAHCGKKITSKRIGESRTIKLSCTQIKSYKDVEDFVERLEFILSLVKVVI